MPIKAIHTPNSDAQKHVSPYSLSIALLFLFIHLFSSCDSLAQSQDEILKRDFASATAKYESYEQRHRRYTQTKSVEVSYLEWGDKRNTDKVLIWLHGSLSNAYEFHPFADALVKAGYRVLSIDQYNAGKTALPAFDASFDDLSIDIKTLMDVLKIDKAVVGGFSRGGFLATHFYGLFPDKVRALILEDGGSVAFGASYFKLDEEALKEKLRAVNLPDQIKEKYFGYYDSPFEAYSKLYDFEIDNDQFEILSHIKRDPTFPKGKENKWITYRGLVEYYHMRDGLQMAETLFGSPKVSNYAASIIKVDPVRIFKSLATPVLVMDANSASDPTPVREENEALAKQHPQFIKLVIFEGVDHNIHFAYPEEFTRSIVDFLKKM